MKYKLIDSVTKVETICDKVTIDGFDYYVSDKFIEDGRENFFTYDTLNCKILHISHIKYFGNENNGRGNISNGRASFKTFDGTSSGLNHPEVIATNNPNIDIPKVIDEVEELALKETLSQIDLIYNTEQRKKDNKKTITVLYFEGLSLYKTGYNKSQQTHPFSDEDMIEFSEWTKSNGKATKELIQLWKEQQPKIVYYE